MDAINLAHGDKKHRVKKTDKKKKLEKSKKKRGVSTNDRHNPKAFSVANIVRTKRTQQRNRDRAQKKEVVPLVDRAEELPPPMVIVVMGPKGCGKSTLIRSLVKLYSSQNMTDIKGPVNVITGKKSRATFYECPLDIFSMTDLAKIADLVILMIDASYGYEMETFEFLNLLQLHGFPKVVGVLTHMDKFKVNKSLQNTKKRLKNRFWTEIYKGAKLFDFTSVVNGKYLKHEIKRLSMYISRLKFRPLVWRNTHPYVLFDRVEDITPSQTIVDDPLCNRQIAMFGYVRGTHLKPTMKVHLIGAGDYYMHSITALEDPCPLPGQTERTTLKSSKEAFLYAPLSNIGRVRMENDGMYIEIKDINYTKPELLDIGSSSSATNANFQSDTSTPGGILRSMQDVENGVDEKMGGALLSLYKGDEGVTSEFVGGQGDDDDDDEGSSDGEVDDDDDEGSDDEDDEDGSDDDEDGDDDVDDDDDDDGYYDNDDDVQNDHDGEAESDSDGDDDDEDDSESEDEANKPFSWNDDSDDEDVPRTKVNKSKSDSTGDFHSSDLKWKENLAGKASASFHQRSKEQGKGNVMTLVYGNDWASGNGMSDALMNNIDADSDDESSDDDELFTTKSTQARKQYEALNALDSSRPKYELNSGRGFFTTLLNNGEGDNSLRNKFWLISAGKKVRGEVCNEDVSKDQIKIYKALKNKFVTGDWSKANGGEDSGNFDDDDEVYGEFEDLTTGEVFGRAENSDDDDDSDGTDDDGDSDDDQSMTNEEIDEQLRSANAAKKALSRKTKDMEDEEKEKDEGNAEEDGDEEYLQNVRTELASRKTRNKVEFGDEGEQARFQHEGVRQGVYCRIVISDVPVEFLKGFQPTKPLILGGLLPHESNMGLITARVKRHRWYKKILKSNDVITFSVGWRRYQSIPIFSMDDDTEARRRHLKYTPEHMHCSCSFYGPMVPPNTGILAYQKSDRSTSGFRISMTGISLENQSSSDVVKKLKLVGTPTKIHKNTAFIKGMFNTQLEVAKFEGSKIKTVSGIRGIIKKSVGHNSEPGTYRATFEDQILMSDIVSCRLWVPITVKEFYNPVNTLLDNVDDNAAPWKGMRTVAEIRRDQQMAIPVNKDSLYKPITRVRREFSKIHVPKKLQESLPFASKPKQQAIKNKDSYMAKRAVVLDPEDRKKRAAIQMLSTIKKDKVAIRNETQKKRKAEKAKVIARSHEKFADVHKEEKKRKYVAEGKAAQAKEMAGKRTKFGKKKREE